MQNRHSFHLFFLLILILLVQGSCKKNNNSVPFKFMNDLSSLKYDETIVLKTNHTENSINWHSSNPYVAEINQNGLVTAMHIGKTIIKARFNEQVIEKEITVTPYVEDIQEPILIADAEILEIESKEKRKLINKTFMVSEYESPSAYGKTIFYTFSNQRVSNSGIIFGVVDVQKEHTIRTFFKERYILDHSEGDNMNFSNEYQDLKIVLDKDENKRLLAIYLHYKE